MSIYGKDIYDYRNNYILNEAYVGKTPILMQIEDKIGELRENLPSYNDDINRTKYVLELNRLFEKQFKMKIFALMIDKQKEINAFTYSLNCKIDIAEKYRTIDNFIIADKNNGYYFKPNNNICVMVHISWGILAAKELTNGEVLAIILHEIGHNFSASIYNRLYVANRELLIQYKKYLKNNIILHSILTVFTFGLDLPFLIDSIKQYNNPEYSNKKANKKQKKYQKKKESKLRGWLSGIKGKSSDKSNFYGELAARKSGDEYINKYYDALDNDPNFSKEKNAKSNERIDEVIADKFTAIYGYGPELSTGLLKMDEYVSDAKRKIFEDNDKKAIEANAKYEAAFRKIHDYDCHPQSVQRAYECLKVLRREVEKDDLDPKVRDVILEQISQFEDIIKDMTSTSEKLSDSQNANRLYNAYVNDNIPDAIAQELEDEIEDALDNVFEKYKDKLEKKYNKN